MSADDKHFEKPVSLLVDGRSLVVESTEQAVALLSDVRWPGSRDGIHANALETCLKVLDGHRSTEDGRARLVEAAKAAGIHADSAP